MNTAKNFTTIYLHLNSIGVFEVVTHLTTHLINCAFQTKQDLNLSLFNMITGINESKALTKHHYANLNGDLMEVNVIQINGGVMIKVYLNVKNVMYVKVCIFLKSRLILNIFYCFCMFVNKYFANFTNI